MMGIVIMRSKSTSKSEPSCATRSKHTMLHDRRADRRARAQQSLVTRRAQQPIAHLHDGRMTRTRVWVTAPHLARVHHLAEAVAVLGRLAAALAEVGHHRVRGVAAEATGALRPRLQQPLRVEGREERSAVVQVAPLDVVLARWR